MVEEECRRYRPTKNYLDHLPQLNTSLFETKMMSYEFERIQNRQPMETLSMKRYELPPPSSGKLSEVSAWQESIENSMAQLEHQWVRAMNLELMLEYGIESWKAYLEVFTALQAKAYNELQALKKQIQDVNWQRKLAQTNAGEKLKTLEAHWVMLVSKNYEIEQQCVELENQIRKINYEMKMIQIKNTSNISRKEREDQVNGQNIRNSQEQDEPETNNIGIDNIPEENDLVATAETADYS